MDKLEMFFIFRSAIEDEKRAQERYREAINAAEGDTELQQMFGLILHEEAAHERRLVEVYQRFREEHFA